MRTPTNARLVMPLVMRAALLAAIVLLASAYASATEWHVSPSGSSSSSGGTSLSNAWSLTYALGGAGGKIQPGDTVWIHGGIYQPAVDHTDGVAFQVSAVGSSSAPIIFRAYQNDRPIIQAADTNEGNILDLAGSYYSVWGLEVRCTNTQKTTSSSGSWPPAADVPCGYVVAIHQDGGTVNGVKLIDNIFHGGQGGIGLWPAGINIETYGNIIYHNGWRAPDRPHGHGIYVQNNDLNNGKRIYDNIVFNNFDNGMQLYGESASLYDVDIEGNIFFNNGQDAGLEGSNAIYIGNPATNSKLIDNIGYNHGSGYGATIAQNDNFAISGNYFVAGGDWPVQISSQGITPQNNYAWGYTDFPGAGFFGSNGNVAYGPGQTPSTFIRVRRNAYDPNRANIYILNPSHADYVDVTLPPGLLSTNDNYELHNAQDYFNDIKTGQYAGGTLHIDMRSSSHTVVPLVVNGNTESLPSSFPQLGAFVLIKTSGSNPSPYCGDGSCNNGETQQTCPADCGTPPGDTTPPTLSGGSPTGTLAAGTTSATLHVVTNEAATCKYATSAGTTYASMTTTFGTTGSTSHSTTISGLSNGNNYNYYVRCRDVAGNADTGDFTVSFSVAASNGDTQVPTVSITSPASGATINAGLIALSATASDNVGVTKVEFRKGSTILGTDTTAPSPYTFTWDATGLSGSQTITTRAYDAAGNTADAVVTFTVNASSSGPVCGNNVCESGESVSSCPADCHAPPPSGNTCVRVNPSAEDLVNVRSTPGIPSDSGANVLGTQLVGATGVLQAGPVASTETDSLTWDKVAYDAGASGWSAAKYLDTYTCNGNGPVCGNGVCESGESVSSCPADCHAPPPSGNTCVRVNPSAEDLVNVRSTPGIPSDSSLNVLGTQLVGATGVLQSGPVSSVESDGLTWDQVIYDQGASGWSASKYLDTYTCNGNGPVCGNGQCESGETHANCPTDCQAVGPVCGNGACESGESTASCPADCPAINSGLSVTHTPQSPASGQSVTITAAAQSPGTLAIYVDDLQTPRITCLLATSCTLANAFADGTHTYYAVSGTTARDPASGTKSFTVGTSPGPVCGNGVIETGETCDNGAQNGNCPAACSTLCVYNECPQLPVCGNAVCETSETATTCPADCPVGQTTVTITAPANGASVGGIVEIDATAPGAAQVSCYGATSAGATPTLIDTDTGSSPYACIWNTAGLSGSRIITAVAKNAAGTTIGTSSAITLNLGAANPGPSVSIASPANGATIAAGTIPVTVSGPANLKTVNVYRGQGSARVLIDAKTNAPFSVNWDASGFSGTQYLSAQGYDSAGNLGPFSDYVTITVNAGTTHAVISNANVQSITTTSAQITWSTNIAADGQVEYWVTTASKQNTTRATAMSTSHSQQLSSLSSGTTYQYRIYSRDATGYTAASAQGSFTTTNTGNTGTGFRKAILLHHSVGGDIYSDQFPGAANSYNVANSLSGSSAYSMAESNYPDDGSGNLWSDWLSHFDAAYSTFSGSYNIMVLKTCYITQSTMGDPSTITQYEGQMRQLVQKMATHPDTFFVIWTNYPEAGSNPDPSGSDRVANSWTFNRWMKDQLPNEANFPKNVYIFDVDGVLAAASRTHNNCGSSQSGKCQPGYVDSYYAGRDGGGDDHPSAAGSAVVGPEFAKQAFNAAHAYELTR